MATTPNFSWPLIQPTDFVTDLPADLEALADDIDADVWAIKGTADAALPETIIDAAGDLIYGSAADTAARLPIGTAGQLLAVNSGATAPEWIAAPSSGGMTLISTTNLNGSSTVILSSIPSTYKHLLLVLSDFGMGGANLQLRTNSSNLYAATSIYGHVGATSTIYNFTSSGGILNPRTIGSNQGTAIAIWIYNYSVNSVYKPVSWNGSYIDNSTNNQGGLTGSGMTITSSVINSVDLICTSGNFSGGQVRLYGVS